MASKETQEALNFLNTFDDDIFTHENMWIYDRLNFEKSKKVLKNAVSDLEVYKRAFESLCHTYQVDTKIIGNLMYYSYPTENELKESLLSKARRELGHVQEKRN